MRVFSDVDRCSGCFSFALRFSFLAIALACFPAFASGQTYSAIMDNGRSSNRVDMIFIGDGYTATQLENEYVAHTNATTNYFFQNTPPFTRYQSFFNAWRINIASNESGADDPNANGGAGIFVDTALDATYNVGGTDRCLYFNTTKANNAVNAALVGTQIDIDMRLGTVNSEKYGGCGGQWGVYAGANGAAQEIAVHEIGHSFANLADEYWSPDTNYTGGEFGAWNVTNSDTSGKWDRWLGYVDPDSDIGAIGYYEGGRYSETGVWRPSVNSKMRALNRPFDAISREKFIWDIYEEVDPLDEWIPDDVVYTEEDILWVDTIDDDVISVQWFVDGNLVQTDGSLDLGSLGLAIGDYQVSARAYDTLLDHSFVAGSSLDWWRLESDPLEQNISWNVSITAVPEPASATLIVLSLIGFGMRRRRSLLLPPAIYESVQLRIKSGRAADCR